MQEENYTELLNKFLKRKENTRHDFSEYVKLAEAGIILLRSCLRVIYDKRQDEAKKKGETLSGPKILIPFLLEKANYYLIASYELSCLGLYNPASSLLRTIYETITKIYFLHLAGEDAEIMYKHDLKLKLTECEKAILTKNQFFKQKVIIGKLYSQELQKSLQSFYNAISTSTHPSIMAAHNDIDYNETLTEDRLGFIIDLECALLIVLCETNIPYIDPSTNTAVQEFIKGAGVTSPSLPNFIPDNPAFSAKLHIHFK